MGLSIPDDIPIAAFDIVDTAGLMKLYMTTIIQPAEEIRRIAAELCMKTDLDEDVQVSRHIILEHTLQTNKRSGGSLSESQVRLKMDELKCNSETIRYNNDHVSRCSQHVQAQVLMKKR